MMVLLQLDSRLLLSVVVVVGEMGIQPKVVVLVAQVEEAKTLDQVEVLQHLIMVEHLIMEVTEQLEFSPTLVMLVEVEEVLAAMVLLLLLLVVVLVVLEAMAELIR
jgi:hypothetical protein